MPSTLSHLPGRAVLSGSIALGGAMALVRFFPAWELEVFARAAAWLTSIWSGAPIGREGAGWAVQLTDAPVVVTTACSATDFFLIVAGLIGFQIARARSRLATAAALGIAAAFPVTVFVNAIRILTVAYAHPWLISRFPAAYETFLHMLVGAGIFLPALIVLNLLLEIHGRHRHLPA